MRSRKDERIKKVSEGWWRGGRDEGRGHKGGGGGGSRCHMTPYFKAVQEESGRQKTLSACRLKRGMYTATQHCSQINLSGRGQRWGNVLFFSGKAETLKLQDVLRLVWENHLPKGQHRGGRSVPDIYLHQNHTSMSTACEGKTNYPQCRENSAWCKRVAKVKLESKQNRRAHIWLKTTLTFCKYLKKIQSKQNLTQEAFLLVLVLFFPA